MNDPSRLSAALAGRYDIERELGAGGMATVYLARDVRHERRVALKVLRPELAAVIGGERFLNEIKTTANLQHAHILPLHDSGEVDGTVFYVMPFVEGESLRDCLTRERQLPIDDAIRIAREVASALDYAHRHGVIHRDIKPENILLHDGQALVADFGIALAASRAEGGTRMTETGMSLGTPHYMSPEQALGERTIDARADVYALGCVTYEMLTGEPPFTGPTVQAIVAKVMNATAERPSTIRSTVPAHVEAAVLKALAKLPADRFRSAADFSAALQNAGTYTATGAAPARVAGTDARRAWRQWLPWGIAAAALGAAALGSFRTPQTAVGPVTRSVLPLELRDPPDVPLNEVGVPFDLSADGRFLVYVGADPDSATETALWLRSLDRLEASPIRGTRGAHSPRFSPDGRKILFLERKTTPDANTLRFISRDGGPATRSPAANLFGRDWSPDGTVIIRNPGGVFRRLDPDGGDRADSLMSRTGVRGFDLSPTGRDVALWTFGAGQDSVVLARLDGSKQSLIGLGGTPRFLDAEHLVYRQPDGTLNVVPVDLDALRATSRSVPFVEGVGTSGGGEALYAVGGDGSLVYATGATAGLARLVWVNRAGREERAGSAEPAIYGSVALSPDDRRVAVSKGALFVGASDVWVIDLAQGSGIPVTRDGEGQRPVWSRDGRSLTFQQGPIGVGVAGRLHVARRSADGASVLDTVFVETRPVGESIVSPDGRYIVYRVTQLPTARDIYYRRSDKLDSTIAFLVEPSQERSPRFSPDGKWLVYVSDRTGRDEVYVEKFPEGGQRISVSTDGGREPVWSRDGSEIFYRDPDGVMMAARVSARPSLEVVRRERLFAASGYLSNQFLTMYDVARDGRFLMIKLDRQVGRTDAVLVRNWRAEVDSALGRRQR